MYYGAQEIVLSLPTTTFCNSAQITIQPFFISHWNWLVTIAGQLQVAQHTLNSGPSEWSKLSAQKTQY